MFTRLMRTRHTAIVFYYALDMVGLLTIARRIWKLMEPA
jgi:hypothetical protein